MKRAQLEDMFKGWFVGDFSPVVLPSKDFEVAVKHYKQGDHEAAHLHKVATEITVLVSGRARMSGMDLVPGDIVTIDPGEATDFTALEDSVTVVVKTPSAQNDKFLA